MRGRIFHWQQCWLHHLSGWMRKNWHRSGWHIRICHFTSLSGCVGKKKRKKPEQTGVEKPEKKKRKKRKNQMQKRKTAAERFQKRSEKSWQSLRGRSDTSEAYFPILRSMICWQRSLKRQDTGLLLLRCREESSGSQMWRCWWKRRVHLRGRVIKDFLILSDILSSWKNIMLIMEKPELWMNRQIRYAWWVSIKVKDWNFRLYL